MTERLPPENSLVLYKAQPARVTRVGEKLEIELPDGQTQKVRPKDVVLLHPGPLKALSELRSQQGEVQTAWEMLAGGRTTLAELAELAYGAYTPGTAWAAWQLVADGLYFRGTPDAITACTQDEVLRTLAARAADALEKRAWSEFLERARQGRVGPEDERYLRDIEALALGRATRSRVLRELGREETPENAHAALLEFGAWSPAVNPYPTRVGATTGQPDLPLPALPDEPRRDLTELIAYAIDDAFTETPDDALSYEPGRLWVHVADPAALALPDSPIDLEARGRGASLYLPEGTVHMLPPAATPLLGLGLAETSPALSFGIDLQEDGQIAGLEIVPSRVRVTRLTYEEAAARLDEEPLRALQVLLRAYQARREAAGAFSLDLPEVSVRVRDGEVTVRPMPSLPSRALVENAMILAGEAVARFAIERGIPLPFTTQDAPETDERPDGSSLAAAYAFRRKLKRSQYRSAPGPHGGLGLAAYVQATSPMRRYLDLVVHQQLRAYLAGGPLLDTSAILERVGATEAVMASVRQAENLSEQHWTLVYLIQHSQWQGTGVVVEKRERNHTVLIPELGLEPQIHLPADPPLDSTVRLALAHVDLPRLDARFKLIHST